MNYPRLDCGHIRQERPHFCLMSGTYAKLSANPAGRLKAWSVVNVSQPFAAPTSEPPSAFHQVLPELASSFWSCASMRLRHLYIHVRQITIYTQIEQCQPQYVVYQAVNKLVQAVGELWIKLPDI